MSKRSHIASAVAGAVLGIGGAVVTQTKAEAPRPEIVTVEVAAATMNQALALLGAQLGTTSEVKRLHCLPKLKLQRDASGNIRPVPGIWECSTAAKD